MPRKVRWRFIDLNLRPSSRLTMWSGNTDFFGLTAGFCAGGAATADWPRFDRAALTEEIRSGRPATGTELFCTNAATISAVSPIKSALRRSVSSVNSSIPFCCSAFVFRERRMAQDAGQVSWAWKSPRHATLCLRSSVRFAILVGELNRQIGVRFQPLAQQDLKSGPTDQSPSRPLWNSTHRQSPALAARRRRS